MGGAAIDPLRRQPNLIALGQTVRHKTAFQSHSDRSGTRDFLAYLVVFPSEILTNNFDFFFAPNPILTTPQKGFPLELDNIGRTQETRMTGLSGRAQKSDDIVIGYDTITRTRRTDGQTPADGSYRGYA